MTRRRGLAVLTVALASALILAVGVGGFAVHWWRSPLSVERPTTLTIEPGGTAFGVAGALEAAGLLEDGRPLPWILRLRGEAKRLQAGEYGVAPGETAGQLLTRMVNGEVVHHEFRILEGSRVADVLAALRRQARLGQSLAQTRPETLLADLGLDIAAGTLGPGHGEGWFFPDTYQFTTGEEDRTLLLRAHAKMTAELSAAWSQRMPELPYRSPYQVLIAASLIEKETSRVEDRPHVSQVLVGRLRRNMRLQVDPTVIYGLGDAFDGDLRRADLRRPTPYNTYVHRGLPPTPIALPGREALLAAVRPSGADYLYFVARGDGSSQFSGTLAEHNAAVRKFQLNRRPAPREEA